MRGKPISQKEILRIKKLRQTGHSLPEICRELQRGSSTVYKFVKNVKTLPEYTKLLREKQGGSKKRARKFWNESYDSACALLEKIEKRDKLFILASIYWGEGTKRELNLINSDPALIGVFISCLKEIGVSKKDLRVSIRLYKYINIDKSKEYWSKICGINKNDIINVNIIEGKKIGKLPYGMCRVRVSKSSQYFKLIISMIEFIKLNIISSYSSTDRTRDS